MRRLDPQSDNIWTLLTKFLLPSGLLIRFNSSMQIVFELSSRYKHVTLNLNSACLLYAYSKGTIQSVPQALPNNAFHVSSNAHECKQTPLTYSSSVRSRPILYVSVRRLLKVRGMKLLRYFFHSLALHPLRGDH